MSDFLERNLSEDVVQKIAKHCSFNVMKDNRMSNFQLVPKELMDSDISPFLRKGELFAFRSSVASSSCWFWHFNKSSISTLVISTEINCSLSVLCNVSFYFLGAFFIIDFASELLCPCSHLRCCWRLEKPFHSGTTTEVHISPAERATKRELHSALEFGMTHIYPKQLNDSL